MAEIELQEQLQPEQRYEDPLEGLMPPEWAQPERDPLRLFDEFDIPDIELGEIDDPNAPPPVYPRYQIQVQIKNGG